MAMYCNNFELEESRDEFLLRAEPPEAFALYPNSNPGPPGPPGPPGQDGEGVPTGGTTGQLLAKASDEDFDTEWIDPPELDAGHVTYDDTETYEDGTVGKEISDLKDAIANKADVIVDSVGPAAIASFPDGADNMPLQELVTTIEPVQDFNGYEYPWSGGGSSNIVPPGTSQTTSVGITYVVNSDGSVKVTGTSTAAVANPSGAFEVQAGVEYILSGCPANGGLNSYRLDIRNAENDSQLDSELSTVYDYGSGVHFTPATTHNIRIGCRIANGYTIQSGGIVFYPMVRLATISDNTYKPYENVCPISGWSAANGRFGANIFAFEQGGIRDADGVLASSSTRIRTGKIPISALGETTNLVELLNKSGADARLRYFYWYSSTDTYLGTSGTFNQTFPINYNKVSIVAGSAYFRVVVQNAQNSETIRPNYYALAINAEAIPVIFPADVCKNKLRMTVESLKNTNILSTWSGNSYQFHGVTFTIETDANGNVTGIKANGTASENADFYIVGSRSDLYGDAGIASGSYIFSGNPTSNSTATMFIVKNGGTIDCNVYDTAEKPVTMDDTTTYRIFIRINSGKNPNGAVFKPMVRPSTVTDTVFEPYGTVYSGTLNLLTGELTAKWAILDMGTLTYNYESNLNRFNANVTGMKTQPQRTMKLMSDIYRTISDGSNFDASWDNVIYNNNNTANVVVHNHAYTVGSELKSAMSGRTLLYELATPLTYQLTPTEINTLLGQNNILFGCGQTSVTYPADTKLYIDRRIAALTA